MPQQQVQRGLEQLEQATLALETALSTFEAAAGQGPEIQAGLRDGVEARAREQAALLVAAREAGASEAQLGRSERLGRRAAALTAAWAGAAAAAEEAANLRAELERTRWQQQQRSGGGSAGAAGGTPGGGEGHASKVPQLKIPSFSGTGEPAVQPWLFLARHSSRMAGLDSTLFGAYTSLEQQQIDARVSCLEGPALDWAMLEGEAYSTVAAWDRALELEFTAMSAVQARAALYDLRYTGGPVAEHDAAFRSIGSLVEGLSQQEAVSAYIRSFAGVGELQEHLERAAPTTWQAASQLARREVQIYTRKLAARGLPLPGAAVPTTPGQGGQEQEPSAGAAGPSAVEGGTKQERWGGLQRVQEALNSMAGKLSAHRRRRPKPQDFGLAQEEFDRRRALSLCYSCGARGCASWTCKARRRGGGAQLHGLLAAAGAVG